MSIKNFLNKYGKNTTSNFDLMKIAKNENIPNFKVLMKDEFRKFVDKKKYKLPCNLVINLHTSQQPGIHWSAVHKSDLEEYYFDSYGLPPTQEVNEFLNKGLWSDHKLQTFEDAYCGQLCLYVLNSDKDFISTILDLVEWYNN